jgi:hypothetical protein
MEKHREAWNEVKRKQNELWDIRKEIDKELEKEAFGFQVIPWFKKER